MFILFIVAILLIGAGIAVLGAASHREPCHMAQVATSPQEWDAVWRGRC